MLEAALNLIKKVGNELEKEIDMMKTQKKSTYENSMEKQNEVYTRFNELMDGTCDKLDAPQRVKLLIKNMLEDKASGW